jgi:hypothetical protein
MRKLTRYLHRATTTRRAMPELWFDLMFVANIAVPLSLATGNHSMLWLAVGLEIIGVGWYAIGWKPVRKSSRRPVAPATTRTRRAPARRKAS